MYVDIVAVTISDITATVLIVAIKCVIASVAMIIIIIIVIRFSNAFIIIVTIFMMTIVHTLIIILHLTSLHSFYNFIIIFGILKWKDIFSIIIIISYLIFFNHFHYYPLYDNHYRWIHYYYRDHFHYYYCRCYWSELVKGSAASSCKAERKQQEEFAGYTNVDHREKFI